MELKLGQIVKTIALVLTLGIGFPRMSLADVDLGPIFRMTSGATERLLTTSCQERVAVSHSGDWFNEGVMGFVPDTPQVGTTKVYRFALSSGSQHFYTRNRMEGLSAHLKEETFNAYFYTSPQPGLLAVYRLAKSYDHFYTTSSSEAKYAITHVGYKNEGVLGYVIDMQIDLCPVPKLIARPGFGGFDWAKAVQNTVTNFEKNTGPAWEHIKTSTGPDINKGWLHFIGEVNGAFNLKCAANNPNCGVHSQAGQARPTNYDYDPQSLVTGTSPCKGSGDETYPAGTITYFFDSNRAELVCTGYDNGSDPGFGSWSTTGRFR